METKIKTVEREKYTERELEDLARDVYNEEVKVLGMTFDALRIVKELDEVYYSELLEGLQEYEDKYLCPICKEEHEDEDDAEECCIPDRIAELEEMKQEYILNESWIPEDQSPSWGDVAEASAKAESKWEETEEGKELKSLLGDEGDS